MKLRNYFLFSLIVLMLTIGFVSAENNISADNTDTLNVDENIVDSKESDTLNVTGTSFSDVQKTIDSSKDNDVVELKGKYTGSKSAIKISKSITIEGNGATLDANKKSGIFKVTSKSLTIKNLNFINSKGAALSSNNCDLTIINCTFSNNGGNFQYDKLEGLYYVDHYYGAVYFKNGDLNICNSSFSNNWGDSSCAINAYNGNVDLDNCLFKDCKHNYSFLNNEMLISLYNVTSSFKNCNFTNNNLDIIYTDKYIVINNCLFENNNGGIAFVGFSDKSTSNSVINVINSTFIKQKRYSIDVYSDYLLNVENCKFSENMESSIFSSEATVNVKNSEFIKNKAKYGGAINANTNVTIINCNFTDNSASYGGSIYSLSCWDKKEVYNNNIYIINSNISNSLSKSNGGAIYVCVGDVNLLNTTITTNNNSKGSQVYLEVGKFNSNNSTNVSLTKINKLNAKVIDVNKLKTGFDSQKRFLVTVSHNSEIQEGIMFYTKVMFKVYTGKKFKIYYSNPSKDPYFKIDSSLSVGKHKVVVIACGKYFTFKKKSTTITIKQAKTIVKAPKVSVKYKKSNYFKVKIKNKGSGKIVPKLKVKIKVYTGKKFKKFTVKTDKNGVIKLNTKKFKKGVHKVTITSKNSNYIVSKKSSITIK